MTYHLKCITLITIDRDYLLTHFQEWYCKLCLSSLFPFNHIEDDRDFLKAINYIDIVSTLNYSDRLFNPLEEIDNDMSPIYDIDPDLHFYNDSGYRLSNCKYHNEINFQNMLKETNICGSFSLCHLNIRSMKHNLHDFYLYLKCLNYDFSIMGISETWLRDDNCDLYALPGYSFVEEHRVTKTGGGVGIFINESIPFKKRDDLCIFNEYVECITIEIEKHVFAFPKNVIISVIYRPPGSDVNSFIENINTLLGVIAYEVKLCYLMGDYNLDLLKYGQHGSTTEFVDNLYSNAILPLINRPTRITQNTASVIDNIFTNDINAIEYGYKGILVTDISDHFPIFYIGRETPKYSDDECRYARKFSYKNKLSFLNGLTEIDWTEIYMCRSAQQAFSLFHSIYLKLFDKHFPKGKIEFKYNNRKPWLTSAIKESIRIKNKLYWRYKKINSCYNECQYKLYRNKLTKLIKHAEKKHYEALLEANKSNLKKTWSILKDIINKKRKQKMQIKFRVSDTSTITDPFVISENFNDFFVNIGHNLARRIPYTNSVPREFMGDRVRYSIFLEAVTQDELLQIIRSLKDGAPGYDEITAKVLKSSVPSIVEPLCYLCNLSLSEGVFPQELKLANVLPLYKSGDDMLFNNYRPVSLLCTLSKVFEKIMYSRLLNFLETYKILIKNQFGFRKFHSSFMALMLMMDKISKALDGGNYVIGIFLDFSKAFDTVNHSILLDKLYHYGVRGTALNWFKSYLCNRRQYVTYNGIVSSMKTTSCGVPQGSILGPLLFLIYINDLYNVCQVSTPILFADDTNLFFEGGALDSLEKCINEELCKISSWLKANKLSLNVKKTHYILFHRKKKSYPVKLIIDDENIEQVKHTKFLGVIIDDKLSWKKHISLVHGKLSKSIGMLIKARQMLNQKALITLYYSFIYPYLTYCNQVWGSTYASTTDKLFILQKKALRIINGLKRRDCLDTVFPKLGILKFTDINLYLICRFMFRLYRGEVPDIFTDLFVTNMDIHEHNTRQCHHFHVFGEKSNLGKFSIRYRGMIAWNSILNLEINPDTSEAVYVKTIKNYITTGLLSWPT